uniref:CSON003605 protein n=1 Tax=Culicoides sonorensis TaxID=179676 RepID=A0A336MM94_CULSO
MDSREESLLQNNFDPKALKNSDLLDAQKIAIILKLIQNSYVPAIDIINAILDLLVCGEFDMESNFVLKSSENICYIIDIIDQSPEKFQVSRILEYI